MANLHKKSEKSNKSSVYYRRRRLAERLTAGGWPEEFSKKLSVRQEIDVGSQCEDLAINPEGADLNKPILWTDEPAMIKEACLEDDAAARGQSFMKVLAGVRSDIAGLSDKKENLEKFLADNSHGGTMSRVDGTMEKLASLKPFAEAELLMEAGASPWLTVVRPWAWRWGASVWPLPGMGAIIVPLESECVKMRCLLAPAAEILATGVSLQDMHTFLDTPSGLELAAKHMHIIKVSARSSLWVPYGYICIPLVSVPLLKGGGEGDGSVFGMRLVYNPTLTSLGQKLDTSVWTAMQTMNDTHTHLTKVEEKKAWRDRSQYFKAVCTAILRAT